MIGNAQYLYFFVVRLEQRMSSEMYVKRIKEYLKRHFGLSEEQVSGMMPDFIATLSKHMDNLERDLQSGDLTALGKSGHTMKGALVNLGLDDYAELAFKIEMAGKNGDTNLDYANMSIQLREVVDKMLSYDIHQ